MHPSDRTPGKKISELLAPAGSPEAFRAAVAAGADAVYMSGTQFGARRFAKNFSRDEIAESVRYAHARGVRVYVTVNTLVHDRELPGVAEYLVWLYSAGVDAVLVQDPGVIALAKRIVPDLVLHASTQMTIHSADGVRWAAAQGLSRVVLARELSLAEVREIAEQIGPNGPGLEVFAHGALCYGYSGQCLLSSVMGGRSGNRGMCAQPCRKPYTLVAGTPDENGCPAGLHPLSVTGRYLLSPKDLAVYPHLETLVQSPVASLKIEGRMKSPEYVAIVVSIYRQALDAISRGEWTPSPADLQDLLLAFNRGFTKGYLLGDRHAAFMARDRPDNRGLFLGTVTCFNERTRSAVVRTDRPVDLRAGDGLFFSPPASHESGWGFSLNRDPVREINALVIATPRPVPAGTRVYLTSSGDLLARARRIIATAPPELRHLLPIDLEVKIFPDGAIRLDGTIDTGTGSPVTVSCNPAFRFTSARSRPLAADQIVSQLKKTGGTQFFIRECMLDYPGDLFAPVAELNQIRRDFLQLAEEALVQRMIPSAETLAGARDRLAEVLQETEIPAGTGPGATIPMDIMVWTDSVDGVEAAVRAGAGIVCFEPDASPENSGCCTGSGPGLFPDTVRATWDCCRKAQTRFILKLPRITRQRYLDAVLPHLEVLRQEGLDHFMADGIGAAQALVTRLPGIHLSGSAGFNIFNGQSVRLLSQMPFDLLTVSPELKSDEIAALVQAARKNSPSPVLAMIVQGAIEAMVTEDCLLEPVRKCRRNANEGTEDRRSWYGIRDETGRIFPIHVDAGCRTHIRNAVETCLVDHLPAIAAAGIGTIIIDARDRTPRYARDMVGIYREACDAVQRSSGDLHRHLPALKGRIKQYACSGITAGPFLSGLKEE